MKKPYSPKGDDSQGKQPKKGDSFDDSRGIAKPKLNDSK